MSITILYLKKKKVISPLNFYCVLNFPDRSKLVQNKDFFSLHRSEL